MTGVLNARTPKLPDLSPEQAAIADHLHRGTRTRPVQTLGGYAGTGKTTIIAHLQQRLDSFGVCAFTGKAADILRRKGLPATTIHSLIYKPVEDGPRVRFVRKSRDETGVCGFIVDEASMVAGDLFADLQAFGLPIVAVGDHGQLPPVGNDAGLMRSPDYRLETIHRNAGPIARFAEHLRKGGSAVEWKVDHPNGDGVFVVERGAVTEDRLARADQIICAFNRTRIGLNRTLRRLNGRPAGDEPQVGDRVICLRNDRAAGVFNGQQGTIQKLDRSEKLMLFQPTHGEPLWVGYHAGGWNAEKVPPYDRAGTPGTNIPFDFAWCVTAHKSQGDEFGKVIVYEERCDRLWEHPRWAYTAASRAKDTLLWVAA